MATLTSPASSFSSSVRLTSSMSRSSFLRRNRKNTLMLSQMRSRSRIGQSDLGANAARIRAYQDAVRETARSSG